jgi:hypothetical protein
MHGDGWRARSSFDFPAELPATEASMEAGAEDVVLVMQRVPGLSQCFNRTTVTPKCLPCPLASIMASRLARK